MNKFGRWLLRGMPRAWKGVADYYLDPSIGSELGGPLNGQKQRISIFTEIVNNIPFRAIVETGTFRGVTTEFFAQQTDVPVFSVEIDSRFFQYAKLKLRSHDKVYLTFGDSRAFINKLAADPTCPKNYVFFYLDAHWNIDLPLFDELECIGENWTDSVVMIDDFLVPDDPGYSFDDYGPGARLCLEYLSPLIKNKWSTFFPTAKSESETNIKRGSVVLVKDDLKDQFCEIKSLRLYDYI